MRRERQKNHQIWLWAGLGVFLAALALGYFLRIKPSVRENENAVGARKAYHFELKDSHERVHSLSELKGRAIILHFWASWCPPCSEELPAWLRLVKKMSESPIDWVAVSLDQSWPDAEKLLPRSQMSPHLLSLLDVSSKVAEQYGSFQYPETYLLGPVNSELRILKKWVGPQDWDNPEMKIFIEKFIAEL